MAGLVDLCVAAGLTLRENQCYGYETPPIFREGKYEVENIFPISLAEHGLGVGGHARSDQGSARWEPRESRGCECSREAKKWGLVSDRRPAIACDLNHGVVFSRTRPGGVCFQSVESSL
jgi:hypothetical protein